VPEVRLAVARTFELEGDWETAVRQYDAWVGEYTLHPSLPSAEFFRALAHYRAGEEAHALTLFTNFVGRFPDHELARRAQDWVGDYYFRENKFALAERHYQELVQKWPASPLAPRARLKAGQAAYRRHGFSDAREHFTWLINNGPPVVPDSTIPRGVVAEAYFALGDLILEELLAGATTPEEAAARNRERFREARNTFKRIVDNLPDDPLVPLAWGKIGHCNYQLAEREPALYEEAAEAYRKVIDSPVSNLAARSQAEVGLGHVRRDQARAPSVPDADRGNLLAQAADHYANVFHGRNVRPGESERPIPRWQKTAGLALAELALGRREWEESVRIYQHLARTYPVLEQSMEKRIADVRKSQETQKN
jgi:TolA-binding protein